jgi:hypothetical protein
MSVHQSKVGAAVMIGVAALATGRAESICGMVHPNETSCVRFVAEPADQHQHAPERLRTVDPVQVQQVASQPETNTHFLAKFAPAKLTVWPFLNSWDQAQPPVAERAPPPAIE